MTNLSGANLNNGAAVGPQGEGRESPSSFPAYPEYKNSGVEWAGVLPVEWQVLKLKRAARLQSGEFITAEAIEEDAQYPVYGGNGLRGYTVAYTHDGEFALIGRQGALCGNINYAEGKFWASEHAVVVYPEKGIVTRWLGELLRSMNLGQYSVSAAQPGLSVERIADLFIPLPSSIEQTQIARFLGHETARIDALIDEQQRLIELLKEKRQAVISHAVTKGLDPTVPMKDSGVEWLGEVPAHWDLSKLKFLCSIQTGDKDTVNAKEDGEYDFYVRSQTVERIDSFTFDCEAVLTAGDGVGVGKVFHYVNGKFDFHQRVYMLNNFRLVCGEFVFYYLRENFYKVALAGEAKSTVDSLRMPNFLNFMFTVPPLAEQGQIIELVKSESRKFDSLVSEAESGVAYLKERRSALISAAVTGKIDVRGWQPPASAPSPELVQEAV